MINRRSLGSFFVITGFLCLPLIVVPVTTNAIIQVNRKNEKSIVRLHAYFYHYVRDVDHPQQDKLGANLSVTPEIFQQQIAYLLSNGYSPVTPEHLYQAISRNRALPEKSVLLSFDDGTVDFWTTAFPILNAYGIPAAIFVVPGFINDSRYLNWKQIGIFGRSRLITIGAHGLNHVSLTRLDNDIAQRQLTLARNMLRAASGQEVKIMAYPNGAYNDRLEKMAGQSGYDLAFSTKKGADFSLTDRYALPRLRPGQSLNSLIETLDE